MKKIIALAAFAALAPMSHAADLITNGGFEDSVFAGTFTTYGTGGGLSGWTIESGTVDLINSYWQPALGHYSLDLNGNSAAVISQSFATVVGQTYNVSFSMAGNTDGGGAVKAITVGAGGDHAFSFDASGKSHGDMGWVTKSFSFVADSSTSTLRFTGSPSNTYYGAALDNVSVTAAVPEPETYAMLIAGLGLLGFAARRKQQ